MDSRHHQEVTLEWVRAKAVTNRGGVHERSLIFYLKKKKIAFFYSHSFYSFCARLMGSGAPYVANASHSMSCYSSCLKMILCLVQFKLCAE